MDEEAHVTGDRFLVEGGHPLRGSVTPAGNKNEALPVLAACLLVAGEVVVDNVPSSRACATWGYGWPSTTTARCAWTRAI
jgi:hypothetical protein